MSVQTVVPALVAMPRAACGQVRAGETDPIRPEVPVSDRPAVPDFVVTLRGYDRGQVDEYVLRLTRDLEQAHTRALAAEQRLAVRPSHTDAYEDLGSHVAGVLRRATEEAQRVVQEAERAAQDQRDLAAQEAVAAEAEREALMDEARRRADELLDRAQRHADSRAEEVMQDAQDEAAELQAQLFRLSQVRDQVREELRALGEQLLRAVTTTGSGSTRVIELPEDAAPDVAR